MKSLEQIVRNLGIDELQIARSALTRLDKGRKIYGPWNLLGDPRDYPEEALEEVVDALHYCAAELVRLRREHIKNRGRRPRVYVCHAVSANTEKTERAIKAICREIVHSGALPIAPQVYLPQFVDEHSARGLSMTFCLELVALCDELRVYGTTITSGMRREIELAEGFGIPVRHMTEEVQP
ncbi:MAG: hypothetical protein MUC50_20365 [Myxococcota bacterium]|jgi:hypothetical protein|nr:hypothetical protein [Myxococcota bacterium]